LPFSIWLDTDAGLKGKMSLRGVPGEATADEVPGQRGRRGSLHRSMETLIGGNRRKDSVRYNRFFTKPCGGSLAPTKPKREPWESYLSEEARKTLPHR